MKLKALFIIVLLSILSIIAGCHSQPVTTNDKTVTIYFARHGKTLFNTFDLVQGWADSPLTDQGIEVAQYLGEGLKGIKFDAFYTSDAGRQRETMQVILKQMQINNAPIHELKGLREVFYGGFEGQPNSNMVIASMKRLGFHSKTVFYQAYLAGKISVKNLTNSIAEADSKNMAENFQQVKTRTTEALHTIVQNALDNKQKNVLAISSGMSMQIMIDDLTNDLTKNKPLSNATIIKITYQNGQYEVNEIGNMAYVNRGRLALTN